MQGMEKYDPKKVYERARNALKTGGYYMKFIKGQNYSKAAKNVVNQLSDKIVNGQLKDIINLSKPIETCDASTYLENIGNEVLSSYEHFKRAYESADPVECIKWLIVASIDTVTTNLHRLQGRLPLDPMTGETYQGVLPDGTTVDVECLSSYPPRYYMLAKNNKTGFQLASYYQVNANLNSVNSVGGGSSGNYSFKNKNGLVFKIGHGDVVIDGALYGEPTFNLHGSMKVTCETLKIESQTKFDAFKNDYTVVKVAKGIMGMFSSQTEQKPTDCLLIEIYQKSGEGKKEQKVTLAKGSGSWLSHIEIGGYIYWKYSEKNGECAIPKILLPSDSRIRLDRRYIIENKMPEAQKAKIDLEKQEREDQASRKKK